MMDAKPTKIPTPDTVSCPDPEPVGVEFLAASAKANKRRFRNRHVAVV
jgi:hypothetical protein